MDYSFRLDFQVRDYECDLQGIVNNAVYQNYLEHTRHEFLKSRNLDFAQVTARGIHLVVTRAELVYRSPLRSGDRFWVGLNLRRKGKVSFIFDQGIYVTESDRKVLTATIEGASLNERGRPFYMPELDELLLEQEKLHRT